MHHTVWSLLIYNPAHQLWEVLEHAALGGSSLFNVLVILRVNGKCRERTNVICRMEAAGGEHINS